MVIAALMLCFVSLTANLVRNQPTEIEQPDGTKLSLFITGDEFYRRVHDANDYTVVLDPESGYAVYAVPDGNGLKPSAYRVGTIDPASLGIRPGLTRDPALTAQRIALHNDALGSSNDRAPSTGTINNIFIFCRFADQSEYTTALSVYSNMCNQTTGPSMGDYFDEESNGQLDISTTFYPAAVGGIVRSYQDSHDRGYFLPYSASNTIGYPAGPTNDPDYYGYVRLQTMLRAAVVSVSGSIPGGLNVDGDSDGNVDNVTFVCQGAAGGWGDPLWPHHWTLHLPSAVYINTKRVWDYNMQLSSTIDVGVICHEMSHSMGFPDLYHYSSSSTIDPVGAWDLMEWDQDIPQHHLTHMKRKYGEWFSYVPTITPSSTPTEYTLSAIDQAPFACYKINSTLANEYYMLEYRRDTGRYESSIPGSGLIIYRIISTYDGSDLNGNAGGPPDEVYIYRPNGTISVNGTINSANYSSTVGRTAIHNYTNPEPWLYSSTGTSLDGNLVITDIGASGGTTITFTVRNDPPNVWDGSTSTNWATASNWSKGTVPTSSEYVEVPAGMPRYPVVSTTQYCEHLTVKNGATLTVGSGSLYVDTDFENYGVLAMNDSAGNLVVGRDLFFRDGSSTNVTASAEIYVTSDVEFHIGSSVNMTNGYLEFQGTGNSYFRTYTASAINHFRSDKDSPYISGFSAVCTAPLTINGAIYVYDGSTLTHPYTGTTILKSNLNVYTGGLCTFSSGTLSMEGSQSATISFVDAGSYLNQLQINKTGTYSVGLDNNNVVVEGNLIILSGRLNAYSYTLNVEGNWTNNVGTSAFLEGTSTVILSGTGTQTMTTEDFNNLVLNKASGSMVIPSGVTVTCNSYDWTAGAYTVSGGTFTVDDLADAGILGTITLSSGTINYTQDSSNYIDLRANLTISGGTFNAYGGNSQAWFSYIDVATLNLSGSGVLDFKNQGIFIPSSTAFNDNITGGTIRTFQGFNVQRADFNPTGGTIELYGSTDCTLTNTAGSNFYHVTINKSATREQEGISLPDYTLDRVGNRIPLTRTNQVTGSGPIDINGAFTIQAGSFTAPATINVAGNWVNQIGPAAFGEGTGSVEFDGSGHQYCNYNEEFNTIIINKSGGALRVNSIPTVVTCNNYTWTAGAVDVLTGTFTAYDLTQNGVYGNFYVNPNGTINIFQDGSQRVDLNGFLYNYGGTINFSGGSQTGRWAYAANAGITMSAGTIDFGDYGIAIYTSAYSLTMNVTGGTIRTGGSFYDNRGSVVLGGGLIEFYGTGSFVIRQGTGSRFYNMEVNKDPTTRSAVPASTVVEGLVDQSGTRDLRSWSIIADTDIMVYGSLTITSGIYSVNDWTTTVYNDLNIYDTLHMYGTGSLDVWDDVNWYSSSSSSVISGTIHCGGNWLFANGCSVNLTGSTTRMDAYYGGNITNNSPTAQFGHLEIYGTEEEPEFDYIYSLDTNHLLVQGNLTVYLDNTLNLNEGVCTVSGNAVIQSTGAVNVGDGGTFTVNGNLDLYGSLVTGPGSAVVHGNFYTYSSGSLSVNQGSFVNDAPWADPYVVSLNGAVNITSGVFEITNKSLTVAAHATRVFYNATVRVGMGFTATATSCFQPTGTGGGLYQIGTGNPVLEVTGNNFLMNYFVQKNSSTNTVYLQDDIVIKGNVTITTGKLNGAGYNLTVGGNWINNVGTTAFVPGTGAVLFNMAGGLQTVTGATNFNDVIDNHTGAALDFQSVTGISGTLTVNSIVTFQNTATLGTVYNTPSAAVLAFYNAFTSTIASYTGGGAIRSFTGSTVNIADLSQNGLYGAWTADGGHLEVHQDSGNWIDLNGPVTIQNSGVMDIYGGSISCYLAYSANAGITMSSGEFNIRDRGLTATPSVYSLNLNVTGGVIRLAGSFTDTRGGLVFAGGEIEFFGTGDVTASQSTGTSFYNVEISKMGGTRDGEFQGVQTIGSHGRYETIDLRANSVTAGSNLQINGNLTITNGTFDVNNRVVTVSGEVVTWSTLKMNNASGRLISGDDFYWYGTSVADITLGELHCGASWYVYNGATVVLPTAVTTQLLSTLAKTILLNSPGTQFGNMTVGSASAGAGYTVSASSSQDLVVTGDLTITANNELDLNTRNLNLTGNLNLNGKLDIHATTATLQGKPVTSTGSILAIDSGTLIYYSSTIPRTTDLWGTLSINSGTYHAVNNGLALRSGSLTTIASGWLIATTINATYAGTFQPAGGTVKVVPNVAGGYSTFTVSNGNWVPNLVLDTTTGINLGADLLVKGSLTITNGSIDATTSNYALTVGGNWANNAGVGSFLPRGGTVTFNQNSGAQTVSGTNNFYNVVDSHVGAALDFQGATTMNGLLTVNNIVTFHNQATLNGVTNSVATAILAFYNAYTSTIASYTGGGAIRSFTGSTVNIADLTQNGLYGSWTADAGHLEVHQDASNWIDLNGAASILNNGILDLYGGNMSCFISYGGNASLTMTSGEFNVKNWGIVNHSGSYTSSYNITGGTISCNGGFDDTRGNFTPAGGTVKFEGSSSATATLLPPSKFHHVLVNKSLTREGSEPEFEADRAGNLEPITRTGELNLNAVTVNGNFTLQSPTSVVLYGTYNGLNAGTIAINAGTLDLNGHELNSSGNIEVYGTLRLTPASILRLSNNKTVIAYGGGLFESLGNAANPVTITRNGATGWYGLIVQNSGTISAAYTLFEYAGANGVTVHSLALVDAVNSFNHCTFRQSPPNGVLLTINNAQTLTVDGAIFPANTWSGTHNVSKTADQGNVTFTNFSGDFSGSAFEEDAYGRIHWSAGGVPEISNLSIERFGVNDVRLHWTYAFPFDSFRIYASDRPEGPFSLVGTTTNTQWTGSTANPRAFYRVTVDYTP
jgi:M6 family metalloprotease-like protein